MEWATFFDAFLRCVYMALQTEWSWHDPMQADLMLASIYFGIYALLTIILWINILPTIFIHAYEEVRHDIDDSPTLWRTICRFGLKIKLRRSWVRGSELMASVDQYFVSGMVDQRDLQHAYPALPRMVTVHPCR